MINVEMNRPYSTNVRCTNGVNLKQARGFTESIALKLFPRADAPRNVCVQRRDMLGPRVTANHLNRLDNQCHVRPLTGVERFLHEMITKFHNDSVSGYRLNIRQNLASQEDLEKALLHLQERMPALRTNIVETYAGYRFMERSPAQRLRLDEVEVCTADAWQSLLSEAMQQKFDPEIESLVRFIIARNSSDNTTDVLAITHHSLVDGEGMISIFKNLLEVLSNDSSVADHSNACALSGPCEPESCPPMMDVQKLRHGTPAFLFKMLINDFILKKMLPNFSNVQLHERTHSCELQFSPLETAQLLSAAKQNGASMYGVVGAAVMIAAEDLFPRHWAGQLISTFTPVSLRKRIDPPVSDQTLGCFIGVVRDVYYRKPRWFRGQQQNFFPLARQIQARIKQQLENNEHEFMPKIFDLLYRGGGTVDLISQTVVPDSLMINNLGRQNFEGQGPLYERIGGFSWMSTREQGSSGMNINFVTVNGSLQILSFTRRFDAQQLQDFSEALDRQLRTMLYCSMTNQKAR